MRVETILAFYLPRCPLPFFTILVEVWLVIQDPCRPEPHQPHPQTSGTSVFGLANPSLAEFDVATPPTCLTWRCQATHHDLKAFAVHPLPSIHNPSCRIRYQYPKHSSQGAFGEQGLPHSSSIDAANSGSTSSIQLTVIYFPLVIPGYFMRSG